MTIKTNFQKMIFLFVLVFGTINLYAQFTEIVNDNVRSDGKFYKKDNLIYTDRIVVKFNAQVVSVPEGQVISNRNDVVNTFAVKNVLTEKATIYGEMELLKVFPEAKWGEVIRTNKRTGASFTGKERSQIFTGDF